MTVEISENGIAVRMRSVLRTAHLRFCSETDGAVTVRDRDTMEQERIKIEDLDAYFADKFTF